MLPKRSRILKKHFPRLLSGRTLHTSAFTMRFLPGPEKRLSIIVSKKVAAKATDRNDLKRKVRAILLANQEKFPQGYSVLWAKKVAVGMKFSLLEKEVCVIAALPH